jgi:hypothetical protein
MKKNYFQILMIAAAVLLFSCRKDQAHEQYTGDPNPIKPDLTIKVITHVAGFITDENNKPVYRAQVTAGTKQTLTDEYGYFSIRDVSLPQTAGLIKIVKNGYFQGYKTVQPQTGKESFVRLKLLPKTNTGTIDAAGGGSVTLTSGARVVLPANGVVLANGGSPYSGTVNVAAHWIDASDIAMHELSMPGDARGVDKEGNLAFVRSFGVLAVELTGSGGQLLQIATGKNATITIPVPATMNASAPASVPLWSFDEVEGLWKQEGTANKTGNVYTGDVSHFSFWDGAVGLPLVNLTTQIIDAALNPLANVAVGVRYAGQPLNAGFGTFAHTDANGVVTGAVPANTSLTLSVLTPCALESYSHNFTTNSTNIDLGTITGNLGQSLVTITGTATNCSGQPVTDGYIQLYDNGFFNRASIVNGVFSFTGVTCTNQVTNLVAIDNTTHQQSSVQLLNLVPGMNNIGAVSACGTSTVGVINYTIDGVPKTIVEPARTISGYYTPAGSGWTTILDVIPAPGTSEFNFQFDGGTAIGSLHNLADIFTTAVADGRLTSSLPLTVTITEFGDAGGFISGQFSGTMNEFTSGTPHTINCNFRVRRYQ